MKQVILVLAMLVVWAFPMKAEGTAGTPPAVISAQFVVFRADERARAFSFASRGMQCVFVTPDRIGQMARAGCPMVWQPAETRFPE